VEVAYLDGHRNEASITRRRENGKPLLSKR
jgi:hypothetical protein